jgi:hypothetical protein
MRRLLAVGTLLSAAVAGADGRHVLVLHSDGNADAATRAKIDTQVLKLARSIEGNVEAGDISFSDAAMATGCTITEPACKEEVLSTLGVDEIVVTTVATTPAGELKVNVKRLAKGAPPHEATSTIPAGQPPDQKMNADVGPMFGLVGAKAPAPSPSPTPTQTPTAGAQVGTDSGSGSGSGSESATPAAPKRTAQAEGVTGAPDGQIAAGPSDDDLRSNHRYEVAGMAIGGGLAALGLIFWAQASSTQSDIDSAMPKSPKDFQNLQDLESKGDSYATLGNICLIGGVAVAAASTYFYLRDRKASNARTAHIAPLVLDHGAGLALSFGGGR